MVGWLLALAQAVATEPQMLMQKLPRVPGCSPSAVYLAHGVAIIGGCMTVVLYPVVWAHFSRRVTKSV